MTPEKALQLVRNYAETQRHIHDCKKRIGKALNKCSGISGERGKHWLVGGREPQYDDKNRDLDLHITHWYWPYKVENVREEVHKPQCEHCYEAHLAIEERKKAKRSLGAIKAAMTRFAV